MKETLHQKPAELTGMSPDQQQRSVDLMQAEQEAHRHVDNTEYAADKAIDKAWRPHPMDPNYDLKVYAGSITVPALELAFGTKLVRADFLARRAGRKAEKHYKKHQGAYQEEAIKAAHDAGVEVNR